MTFTPLASSSHGNAYIVDDGHTRLLLECGLSFRRLQQLAGFRVSHLDAVLVSHEHKDHSRCAAELIRAGLPVYMSEGTSDALELDDAVVIADREQFSVGTMEVVPFRTFHDAAEPLGFLIRSAADGDVLAMATDTVSLAYRFPGVSILALEANYDSAILSRCERIPDKVRRRIVNSHMEIDTLCNYLRTLDLSNCREIWLLHLSDATSHELYFMHKVQRVVPSHCTVAVCPKGG